MMNFLQEGPAQTLNYFIAGYAVIFGVMAIYWASIVVRRRSLMKDLEMLDSLAESQNEPAAA
jgi:hypothetical protein